FDQNRRNLLYRTYADGRASNLEYAFTTPDPPSFTVISRNSKGTARVFRFLCSLLTFCAGAGYCAKPLAGEIPGTAAATGRVPCSPRRDAVCDKCRLAAPWCFPLAPKSIAAS